MAGIGRNRRMAPVRCIGQQRRLILVTEPELELNVEFSGTRYRIDLLRDRPRRAGELAEATRISFPAMSRHLKKLRKSGLVEEDRDEFDSRVRIYRLRNEPMSALKAWLEATETMWTRQLSALKKHLNKMER